MRYTLTTFCLATFLFIINGQAQINPAQEQEFVNKAVFLQLVNDIRKTGCQCGAKKMPATHALKWNKKLEKAAVAHSFDQDKRDRLTHTSANGKNVAARAKRAGYKSAFVGENVAYDEEDEQSAFITWKESPGHCENMMDPDFRELGIARKNAYWTMDLGSPDE